MGGKRKKKAKVIVETKAEAVIRQAVLKEKLDLLDMEESVASSRTGEEASSVSTHLEEEKKEEDSDAVHKSPLVN